MRKIKFLILVLAVSIAFVSCEKDEEISKDYVGTWLATETQDGATVKEQIILTESTIQQVIQIETTSGAFVDFMGFKGGLLVSGKNVTVTIKSIGMADINWETGTIGALVWYTSSDEEYSLLVEDFGGETLTAEYSISGNQLTLTTEEGSTVYIKQ